MKAVLYLRYSDDKQQASSITGQRNACMNYCNKNDIDVIGEYVDEGLSASKNTDKRSAFLNMIRDSASHKFQAIVVYSFDRFSREFYDIARFEHELELNNVIVLSATEINEASPVGRLTKRISQSYAVYYSEELSLKVQRGMNEHKKLHHYLGGTIPFGFKISEKNYIVDPVNAKHVEEIFTQFNNGVSMFDIIKNLNMRFITNTNGKPFSRSSLYSILSNEKYIGIYKYEIDGQVFEDDALPHLISDELFYSVQLRLGKRLNQKKRESFHQYLLSGVMYHNLNKMEGVSSTGRNQIYYYYMDPTTKFRVSAEYVESNVLGALKEIVNDDFIRKLSQMCFDVCLKNAERESELPRLEKEKAEIKKSISKMLAHYHEDDFDDVYGTDFEKLRDKMREVNALILQEKANQTYYTIDEFYDHFKNVLLLDNSKPEYDRVLIDYLVRSVSINDKKELSVILNSPNISYGASKFSMVGDSTNFTHQVKFYI